MPVRIEREKYKEQATQLDRLSKIAGIFLINLGSLEAYVMHNYLALGQPNGEVSEKTLAICALSAAYRFTDGFISYQTRERPMHFTFSIIEKIFGLEGKLPTKSGFLKKAEEN